MPKTIRNPILKGFNPDPSIVRVGEDYYIATSTFEWFPGVQIHHSRDLVHWELLTHPLDRISQLDLRGCPSSGGVWAPCLTHTGGLFHLVYTDMKNLVRPTRDMHNYMVTSPDVMGPWSQPVYLHSRGFDPSLFFDDDGRAWLVSMSWDHRKGRNRFGGIIVQEYSAREKALVGPVAVIFTAGPANIHEGPHIYKRKGFYYLLTAEGGTGLPHSAFMARSRSLFGPYEPCPWNPLITSRDDPALPLQKAGHADIVETPAGEWYMVHLCARPLPSLGRCTLGRETAIQRVEWTDDGWLRLEGGGHAPRLTVPAPKLPARPFPAPPVRDDFDSPVLGVDFQSLRVPLGPGSLSLTERPGFLRLSGGESLVSKFHQSLVARRWQSFRFTAETRLEFSPRCFQQMAGLVCLYDVMNWYYLRVTRDEERGGPGRSLGIMTCVNGQWDDPLGESEVHLPEEGPVYLRVDVELDTLKFSFSPDGGTWTPIGPTLDASTLSDEASTEGRYTGAFVGLCCQDLTGLRLPADFDWFEYREREE